MTIAIAVSALVLYILETQSKKHIEYKLYSEKVKALEKVNSGLNREYKKLYAHANYAQKENAQLAEDIFNETKALYQYKSQKSLTQLHNSYEDLT
jgi:uncharacterized protein YoxC